MIVERKRIGRDEHFTIWKYTRERERERERDDDDDDDGSSRRENYLLSNPLYINIYNEYELGWLVLMAY